MHAHGQALAAALAPAPQGVVAEAAIRGLAQLQKQLQRARPPRRTRCRAATLPPLDHLAEACAPEGAIYVDGVLFGGPTPG